MAATYTDNGTNTPNGSHLEFTYTFPVILSTDVKVSLNGVTQATTKYTVSTSPAKITFNNTSVDSTVQETTGAPKTGVTVRIYRETAVGKASGDEDPKAVFAAGSSVRAADLNSNFEQVLFAVHEKQNQLILAEDIDTGAVTSAKILDDTIVNADVNTSAAIAGTKVSPNFGSQAVVTTGTLAAGATTVTGNIAVSGTVDGRDVAADGTKLDTIESNATADQSNAEIRTAVEAATDSNVFTDADHSKLNAIEANATADQTNAEIRTAVEAASDSNVFTDADHSKLNGIEAGATADQTLSDISGLGAATLTGSETLTNKTLTSPVINDMSGTAVVTSGTSTSDTKVYSAKRADEKYYQKGSADDIEASGVPWSGNDSTVATTAAIDKRIVDIVDDVGGFVALTDEGEIPQYHPEKENTDTADRVGTILSIATLTTTYTPSTGTCTIQASDLSNHAVNATITDCGSTVLSSGYGVLVETKAQTDAQYAAGPSFKFHRLVPKATEVTTVSGSISNVNTVAGAISNVNAVAGNATNINTVAGANSNITSVAGSIANVNTAASNISDVNNFADLYQIATSAPSTDGGGNSLAAGDMWFDSSSNKTLKVHNGTAFQSVSPTQSVLNDISIVSGQITYLEDLGSIADALTTGTGNNINTVATSISNVNTVAGAIANVNTVAADATDIGAVAAKSTEIGRLGTTAAVADLAILGTTDVVSDLNTLATTAIVSDMDTLADISSNITTAAGISSNITTVAGISSNVTSVAGIASNVTTVANNISNVSSFAGTYQIASSNPSTDGAGNSLAAGDLYFNTTANELKVYNGSAWQGGVTATGNLAGLGANTFTGNISFSGSQTVDGRDVSADGTKLDGIEASATADQTAAEIVALIAGQTIAPNVITTTNLTLDFGSIA